ncbi:MAG: phosphoribosyltransferase [Gemmatimonadales bacterium]
MATTRDYIQANRPIFGCVPTLGQHFACELCLGPVTGYARCFACNQLFVRNHVHQALWGRVVPMTSALNPSPWYTMLSTYKRGHVEHGPVLVSLAYEYLSVNAQAIAGLLGGPATMSTIVPSKRGFTFEQQPFRKTLALVDTIRNSLRHTLNFRDGATVDRWSYAPDAFAPGPDPVQGARVLLLEDSWVTGATAMSAAGALVGFGAVSVAVIPLARVVDQGFWEKDHPYRTAMVEPYRLNAWPR